MNKLLLVPALVGVLGCSAQQRRDGVPATGLSFPIAEPRPAVSAAGTHEPAPPMASAASSSRPPRHGYLPDPEPVQTPHQWEYVFDYDAGEVTVRRVRPLLFEQPVVTERKMGRFAIELWIGRELIERVRFDFPGLAAAPPLSGRRRSLDEPPNLAARARTQATVRVPDSPRATRAVLVDRATGLEKVLPWPPDTTFSAGGPG